MKAILLLLALLPAIFGMKSYENHATVRVNGAPPALQQYFLDHFDVFKATYDYFEMQLSPQDLKLVKSMGLDIEILHDNLQALIDEETVSRSMVAENSTWFSDYHTYDQIKAWYAELARLHPGTTYTASIGKTHQGRDVFAYSFGTPGKPQIFFQGLIHAREWIAGAVVQYITYHFLNDDKSLLPNFEFIVIPVVNPDGYTYSWTNDRLWRKNRRNNGGSYGVDLNRNWNSHWGQGGSSSIPSSDTYMGPSVASEPEVQAISKFFLTKRNIIAAIDFHCYSQLILRPYGWTSRDSPHEDEHYAAGAGIQSRIRAVHGKIFDNIKSIELYVTTGTTSDWFYDEEVTTGLGRSIYSYTIELRPASAVPGFQLPPSEIIPSGQEIVPAFKFFVENALANPLN
jgi:murein tripeptide amidase MpaA